MIKWTEFDKATGKITQAVFGSTVVPPDETPTLGVLSDVLGKSTTHYVDPTTQQLTPLPNPHL